MEQLKALEKHISGLCANKRLFSAPADALIDAHISAAREELIGQLDKLAGEMVAVETALRRRLNTLITVQTAELSVARAAFPSAEISGGWKMRPKRKRETVKDGNRVFITPALALSATRVPSFKYVRQDGGLYYVENAGHFAVRLCGQLLHGNIGNIYANARVPLKVKGCKFSTSCSKQDNCDYYHDPAKFSGSKDVRNYVANSWLYSSGDNLRPGGRHFGSLNNLDTDITFMRDEDVNKFRSQTMHDLLCSLLLGRYSAPRAPAETGGSGRAPVKG